MMEGPGADSEEKRVLASDLDTVMVDSLKALDLSRPIREADISLASLSNAGGTLIGRRRLCCLGSRPKRNSLNVL
jgi:hypothetical protein